MEFLIFLFGAISGVFLLALMAALFVKIRSRRRIKILDQWRGRFTEALRTGDLVAFDRLEKEQARHQIWMDRQNKTDKKILSFLDLLLGSEES